MVVLPIMNKDIMMKITLNFKNPTILRNQLDSSKGETAVSDIIVGKNSLNLLDKKSIDKMANNPLAITEFIRKNIAYSNTPISDIKINTKKYPNSDFYDTYIIPIPSYQNNKVTDYIYGLLVNSIRYSTPFLNKEEKLDLSKLKIDELFSTTMLQKALYLKNRGLVSDAIKDTLIKEGYSKQIEIIDFINSLDYSINDQEIALISEYNKIIDFFSAEGKTKKFLVNYKNMAKENFDCYVLLGAFNNLLYNKPLEWHNLSKEQQKILQLKLYKDAA